MAEGGVGGSDESFISFAFAVTSVILIVLYIPWIIGKIRRVYLFYKTPKKIQMMMVNPVDELVDSVTYIPKIIKSISKDPQAVVAGARICMKEKVFFIRCVMPKFLKFVIRPRILVPLLWIVLLSSTMYTSLTFDPHAILGVPVSATPNEIKKTYRALARRYHPDHNKTEEARHLFIQIRRAYKALVDPKAFEEEEEKGRHLFAVGVALPEFLTSRKHDGLVLFGLLSLLFIVPFIVWYKFTNDKKIPKLIWRIRFDKERCEHFLQHFGIPEDPKYVEKRDSRIAVLQTLIATGIVPPYVREDVARPFPPLRDFVERCLDADRNKTVLTKLGLSEKAIAALQSYMATNGVQLVTKFEESHSNAKAEKDGNHERVHLVSPSEYTAARFLFKQHTEQVDEALAEMQQLLGGNVTSVKKLLNAHDEMYNLLDTLYSKPNEKPNPAIVAKLVSMPERICDIVDSIEPEVQLIYQRFFKQMMEQQKANAHGHTHGNGVPCAGNH